jgi:hypothetical protein
MAQRLWFRIFDPEHFEMSVNENTTNLNTLETRRGELELMLADRPRAALHRARAAAIDWQTNLHREVLTAQQLDHVQRTGRV